MNEYIIPSITISQGDIVKIDFSVWSDEHGTLQLWHRPHGALVAHMVDLSVYDGHAIWTVTEEDATSVGMGKGMLVYNVDSGKVLKSNIFDILVA